MLLNPVGENTGLEWRIQATHVFSIIFESVLCAVCYGFCFPKGAFAFGSFGLESVVVAFMRERKRDSAHWHPANCELNVQTSIVLLCCLALLLSCRCLLHGRSSVSVLGVRSLVRCRWLGF